jgi:hypothetical protein
LGKFNTKLVDSLDFLNKVLAGIFIFLAGFKLIDLITENVLGAVFESLTIIGVGILTCGYIALMLNINTNVEEIRNKMGRK